MSSLSKAQKDISTSPVKGSVVAPVNKKAKDADIERKIRLFGAIDALRHHKLPSNAQLDDALRYILDSSPSSLDALSPEGKRLVTDVKDVVATLRMMIMEHNADEMIQDLTWKLTESGNPLKDQNKTENDLAGKGKEAMQGDREQAVKHVRTLVTLVLTNSEVRKLLGDFSTLGRDLLARGAGHTASRIAPPSDALDNIDKPAPENEFKTEGGRTVGTDETPTLEARLPGIGGAKMDPRQGGAQAFDERGGEGQRSEIGSVSGAGDVKGKMHGLKEGLMSGAKDKMGGVKEEGARQAQEVKQARDEGDDEAVEQKKGGMKEKMRQFRDNVKDGISDAMPQQNKDNANERMERGKKFFNEEFFPKERRDQFIFRGKKVILECQNHDNYQEAMRWLISFVEGYIQQGHDAARKAKHHAGSSGITSDPTLNICLAELRTLLERFANGLSMTIITDAVDTLADDARRDPALRNWFSHASVYAKKVLLEPGYILDDQCNVEANKLRESGSRFYNEQYKGHFENLFQSVGDWCGGFKEDPVNHQFGEDWARLTRDLLFDSEGSLKFKPELWNDIRKVLLPVVIDQVGYIPIPRIEYTDESVDLVVENLTLQGQNIFPNIVALETNNYVKFSPYSAVQDVTRHHVTLSLQQIQADMRDVAFYYHKKTGLPKMKDSGVADVLLGGSGLSATIELVSSTHDPTSVFKVHNISVKVDTLKFAIRDSNHDFLYKTLRPLATGLVKRQIEKVVGDGMRTFFEYLDGELVTVRDRVNQAKGTGNRAEMLQNIFSRGKQEAGSAPSIKSGEPKTSQFKIVSDKRDSLLPGEGHQAGWANRITDITMKGEQDAKGLPTHSSKDFANTSSGSAFKPSRHGAQSGALGSNVNAGPQSGEQTFGNKGWQSSAFAMNEDHGAKAHAGAYQRGHVKSHSKKHSPTTQVHHHDASDSVIGKARDVRDAGGFDEIPDHRGAPVRRN